MESNYFDYYLCTPQLVSLIILRSACERNGGEGSARCRSCWQKIKSWVRGPPEVITVEARLNGIWHCLTDSIALKDRLYLVPLLGHLRNIASLASIPTEASQTHPSITLRPKTSGYTRSIVETFRRNPRNRGHAKSLSTSVIRLHKSLRADGDDEAKRRGGEPELFCM